MKWLAAVWRSPPVVVWSRAVDELALRRPCAPCPPLGVPLATHLRFSQPPPPPTAEANPPPPILLRRASGSLAPFSLFLTLSETVALLYLFFSSIITLPGMSAASTRVPLSLSSSLPSLSLSLSLAKSSPPSEPPRFIIVFRDISRFFLLWSPLRATTATGEASSFS